MAILNFAKFVLISHLACMAIAAPCQIAVDGGTVDLSGLLDPVCNNHVFINGKEITRSANETTDTSPHHVAKRSTMEAEKTTEEVSASLAALRETGKLLKLTTLLPAETLEVLRKVAVPLLNTTLALPANILEGVANPMSLGKGLSQIGGQARSSTNALLEHLLHLKLKKHGLSLHKNLTLGPLSIVKILEIGLPAQAAPAPPPAAVVVPDAAPAPVVIPVTPAPPVVVVPEPKPVPVIIPVTPAPPVVVVPEPKPEPVIVPVTAAPPVVVVPVTTPPPIVEATTPAPPVPAPVPVAPVVVVPVVAPPPPGDSQIAIVQQHHSEPAADSSKKTDLV